MSEEDAIEADQVKIILETGPVLEKRFRRIEEALGIKANSGGKGEVLPTPAVSRHAKIAEALRSGSLKEQWERPISTPTKPTAGLASLIYNSDAISGKLGDTVNITVVKPFDATTLANVGDQFSGVSGIYSIVQTTLKEAGEYTIIPYPDLEKISESLIAAIEEQAESAVMREIDEVIIDTAVGAANVNTLDKSSATVYFDADWIPEAMGAILKGGRKVKPQDLILVLNPYQYEALLLDLVSSTAISMIHKPEIIQNGLVTEYMGVTIYVTHYLKSYDTGKYYAVLMHKNALAFAPKREMLFETEKDTKKRELSLTFSYTFGVAAVDGPSICRIKCGKPAS